ncbi:hypothetical protein BREVNS_0773 [Brevinematales bacterium NS]|nr:hypothetical protein [Brevinematales bacterium]QJR21523.1 hypothetical protein BREVNS_0773 [Brevinematales bacterium NS]
MKKLNQFFLYLFLLIIVLGLAGFFYFLQFAKMASLDALIASLRLVYTYLPILAGLALLWGLVFQGGGVSQSTAIGPVILYIFIIMGGAIALQEIAIPALTEMKQQSLILQTKKAKGMPKFTVNPTNVSASEFTSLSWFVSKENLAFAQKNTFLSFEKLYKGPQGVYYGINFKIVSFDDQGRLDYVFISPQVKAYETDLFALSARAYEYKNGNLVSQKGYTVKKLTLPYPAGAIYSLRAHGNLEDISLIDVLRYNDYVYGSRLNFYHVGILIFFKISYYTMLIVIIILCAGFGLTFQNQRLVGKDIVPALSFLLVSTAVTIMVYDILLAAVNMVYGLII